VVVERPLELAGDLVAQTGAYSLYRVRLPLRMASRVDGVYADGWSGSDATYTRLVAPKRPARIQVKLSREAWSGPDVPATVSVVVRRLGASGAPVAKRSTVLHRLQRKVLTLAVPAQAFRVEVHFEPTFSPAEFGLGDARQLGAQVAFAPAGGR
jgi:hypothetical protein